MAMFILFRSTRQKHAKKWGVAKHCLRHKPQILAFLEEEKSEHCRTDPLTHCPFKV